jgi:hypothetical protein
MSTYNNNAERITEMKARYGRYLAAETAILNGAQEYTIGDRTLKRGDLKLIAEQMSELANEIAKAEAGGTIRVKRVVMRYDS